MKLIWWKRKAESPYLKLPNLHSLMIKCLFIYSFPRDGTIKMSVILFAIVSVVIESSCIYRHVGEWNTFSLISVNCNVWLKRIIFISEPSNLLCANRKNEAVIKKILIGVSFWFMGCTLFYSTSVTNSLIAWYHRASFLALSNSPRSVRP